LASMGPSARHIYPAALQELVARLPTLSQVTGSVDLRVYVRSRTGAAN
jgi:hypothetical protein